MTQPAPATQREVFDTLLEAAAAECNVTTAELLGDRRVRRFTEPRMIMYYLLTVDLGWFLADVGKLFGRNHSTIANGRRTIVDRIRNRDAETIYTVAALRKALNDNEGITTRYEELADLATSTIRLAAAMRETLTAAGAVVDRMEAVALDAQRASEGWQR